MEGSKPALETGAVGLTAAIFVAVDLAAKQCAACGAEHGAEQLVAAARNFVTGEAADRAADQETGRAIVLLAAIATIIAAPDAGVRIDALVLAVFAFIPLLGWANWVIIPFAVVGLALGAMSDKTSGRNLNIVVIVIGVIRLMLGGGII